MQEDRTWAKSETMRKLLSKPFNENTLNKPLTVYIQAKLAEFLTKGNMKVELKRKLSIQTNERLVEVLKPIAKILSIRFKLKGLFNSQPNTKFSTHEPQQPLAVVRVVAVRGGGIDFERLQILKNEAFSRIPPAPPRVYTPPAKKIDLVALTHSNREFALAIPRPPNEEETKQRTAEEPSAKRPRLDTQVSVDEAIFQLSDITRPDTPPVDPLLALCEAASTIPPPAVQPPANSPPQASSRRQTEEEEEEEEKEEDIIGSCSEDE